MSRQQGPLSRPGEDRDKKAPAKKAKPWSLWHRWKDGWYRVGRYRTEAEARSAMDGRVRKYGSIGLFGTDWTASSYRVLHDKYKPE